MPRRSLKPELNKIRAWVRQGRTDAWIAHQLEVTVQQIEAFKRDQRLDADDSDTNGDTGTWSYTLSVTPSTFTATGSKSVTVDASNGTTDSLTPTGNNGTVTYSQVSSDSACLRVDGNGESERGVEHFARLGAPHGVRIVPGALAVGCCLD